MTVSLSGHTVLTIRVKALFDYFLRADIRGNLTLISVRISIMWLYLVSVKQTRIGMPLLPSLPIQILPIFAVYATITWSQTSCSEKSSQVKASGGDGSPAELFQILKDDAVKVFHPICQQIWKTQHSHRPGKGQFSLPSQRRAMPVNVQTITQLHLFQILAKKYSKSFKLGFNSMWTKNFQER